LSAIHKGAKLAESTVQKGIFLLEQFTWPPDAAAHPVPLVLTRGDVDDKVLAAVRPYNAAVAQPVLRPPIQGRLNVDVSWQVRRSAEDVQRIDEARVNPLVLWAGLQQRKPAGPSGELAAFLLADDGRTRDSRAKLLEVFTRLESVLTASHNRAALDGVVQRLPAHQPFRVRKAMIDLSARGGSPFVTGYLTADTGHAEIITKPLLAGAAPPGELAGLAEGVEGQDEAVTVLRAVEYIGNNDFEAAARYIDANKHKLSSGDKVHWVTTINALGEDSRMPGHKQQLLALSEHVVSCWDRQGPA
jgi:hypothetical protein